MNLAPLVYIVDDTADYRFLVELILKRALPTCLVRSFVNGQAFLTALSQLGEKPDLVLLDQHMPQLSGYQTLIALRQQIDYKSIPVVVMSMHSSPSEIDSFYKAGATKFLSKSVDFYALQKTLVIACTYASKP